jgi:hypothetical protein
MLDRVRWLDWRESMARLQQAVRSFDVRRLPNLDRLNLRHAAIALAIAAAVVLSATWTIRAKPWGRSGGLVAQAAAATPAPVIQGLVPKQKLRVRTDEQPIAVTGQQFVEGMSVTISTPDGFVTTYGSVSLFNVSPTRFNLRAIVNVPGTYHLLVRTPDGRRSNEVSFVVDR